MHTAYISIGSNLGNKKQNIGHALRSMEYFSTIEACSRPYRTKPYGYLNQPDFINMVIKVSTEENPLELLVKLQKIENDLGRVRSVRWGERTIDLDIVFYDSSIINVENLTIPHPDMQNRYFVLKPMADIAPDFIHPVLKKTIKGILEELILKNKF